MATAPRRFVEPPVYDPPITGGAGQHSQAWTEYHQSVADRLADLGAGVVDGSNAPPGAVGEYLTATAALTPITTHVVTQMASLTLTPGDWEVWGHCFFQAGAGTHTYFAVGINGVDTSIAAMFPTTAFDHTMQSLRHRRNITAAATLWVVVQAGFTGPMSASATIEARRMR